MRRWLSLGVAVLITIIVMGAACAPPEKAITPEEFYRGRIIRFMLAYPAGGPIDGNVRVILPFLTKEMGAKAIVIDNMPGGGGYMGHNWLYATAPKDGSVIGYLHGQAMNSNVVFDLGEPMLAEAVSEYSIIGCYESEKATPVAVTPESPYESFSDLKGSKEVFKTGVITQFSATGLNLTATAECLGLENLQVLLGYVLPDAQVATYRGELDIIIISVPSAVPMVEAGMLRVIGSAGDHRHPLYPDSPALTEVCLPGTEKWVDIKILMSSGSALQAGPPGMPEDRLEFIRECYVRMPENPELWATMERMNVYVNEFFSGEETIAKLKIVDELPQSEKDYIKSTVLKYIKK